MAVGGLAAPAAMLERLGEALRAGAGGGGLRLTDDARLALGLGEGEANRLLRGLGFTPVRKPGVDEPRPWRRRSPRAAVPASAPAPLSPFAALAALKPPPRPEPRQEPRPEPLPGARRRPRGRTPRRARVARNADGG
jgi:hypothetical protein